MYMYNNNSNYEVLKSSLTAHAKESFELFLSFSSQIHHTRVSEVVNYFPLIRERLINKYVKLLPCIALIGSAKSRHALVIGKKVSHCDEIDDFLLLYGQP